MISLVLPSRDRPIGLKRVLDSIYATTKEYDIEIIVILDEPDISSHKLVEGLPFVKMVTMPSNYVNGHPQQKAQAGYKASRGEWIVFVSDDIVFHPGWLKAALAWPNKGFVGLCDPNHGDNLATHPMVTREFVETVMNGHFGQPWYYVWWADNEWKCKAMKAGTFTVCPGAGFDHLHADASPIPDSINEIGKQYRERDQITFYARHNAGFPEDWPEAK